METVIKAMESVGGLTSAHVVVALTISGALTMAVIQIMKDMTPIRRGFQRRWIAWWMRRNARVFDPAQPPNADTAEGFLVELATGNDRNAFFDLSADQLVGQMNAAAQITLDYPQQY